MSEPLALQLYSFNQRNTSVSQRDLISLTEQRAAETVARLREELDCEAAVLATCHRTEFYLFDDRGPRRRLVPAPGSVAPGPSPRWPATPLARRPARRRRGTPPVPGGLLDGEHRAR